MSFSITGINYRQVGIQLRERVAFTAEALPDTLAALAEVPGLSEGLLLSTCNRTEIYHVGAVGSDELLCWLAHCGGINADSLRDHAYHYQNDEAVMHGMRVACGLDSMVLGEPQILGQLKSAVALARGCGLVGRVLEPALQQLFRVAKQVRTETSIGRHPVSLPSVIASLASQMFAAPRQLQVLAVGAGDIIRAVLRHLAERGTGSITIANRSQHSVAELVHSLGADYLPLGELPSALARSDMVICGVDSAATLLSRADLEQSGARPAQSPLLVVDLAVPRNVEPAAHVLENVYLYSLDNLWQLLEESRYRRETELPEAEALLATGLVTYRNAARERAAGELIAAYRGQAAQLRDAVLGRALRQLDKGCEPREVATALAQALTRKLTHVPSAHIRRVFAGCEGVELEQARTELWQLMQSVRNADTESGDADAEPTVVASSDINAPEVSP